MIAEMDKDGCLIVKAETGVEAYALTKWVCECPDGHGKLKVDTEAFAMTCAGSAQKDAA